MQVSSPHMANQSFKENMLEVSHAVLVGKLGILNDQRTAQDALKDATVVYLLWSKLCDLYCLYHFTLQMMFYILFMIRKTVTKDNENNGRVFYVCSKPRSEQCGYFRWKGDERQCFF